MRRREFIALFGLAPALWPTRGRAQHGPPYRVGYLAYSGADDSGFTRVFADRLRELGLVEGQNLTLSYRSADGHADKLPGRAAELLQADPDVLVAGFGTLTAKTLKAATTTVP